MNKIKIVFFDIDGTLIDMDRKEISEKTIEALTSLSKNKIKICIATGRPLSSVPKFAGIEFDAFLTFNGSYCCTNNHEIIFSNPIPKLDVLKIIDNASRINRPVSIASVNRIGANGKDQDLIDYYWISKQLVNVIDDFDDLANEDIYQIMLGCYESEYDKILENVTGAKITAWWNRAADIIPANGGKGIGIAKVLEYFGLTKEEALAFGDGTNDIEMLQAVGKGIAMANASDNVKEIADDICGSVKEDGIYHYLKNEQII